MIHENVKEIRRNSSDLGLGVRFKSCVTVQAPAQFGTHKNDSFQVFRIRNHSSGCILADSPSDVFFGADTVLYFLKVESCMNVFFWCETWVSVFFRTFELFDTMHAILLSWAGVVAFARLPPQKMHIHIDAKNNRYSGWRAQPIPTLIAL